MVTSVNDAALRFSGYSKSEIEGKHFSKLSFLSAKDFPKYMSIFGSLVRGRVHEPFEILYHRKDGTPRWVEVHTSLLKRGIQKAGIQTIMRDITERKMKEEEVKRRLMKFNMADGNLYLVKESHPALSLEAFKDVLKVGYRGLVISRTPEMELRKVVEGEFDFLWLAERGGEKALPPEFDKIELLIEKLPMRSVLLFDRLDYLLLKTGFRETLFFMQRLREIAYLKSHITLFSLDPATLSDRKLRLLEKETMEVEPRFMVRLPEDMLEILRFVYKQNNLGVKPNYSDVREETRISKPTVGKRIRRLIAAGYLVDAVKGSSKVLELTQRGRNLF